MDKYFCDLQRFGHGVFTEEQLQDKCDVVRRRMQARPVVRDPEVSVVVPAHRERSYILATLKSLAQQTNAACEFVIVSNGEPEGNQTQRICMAAGFNVINEQRKGIALARDIGLRAARGRVVVSTDADTIHHPELLQVVDDYFRFSGCEGATGPVSLLGLSVRRRIYAALVAVYKNRFERNSRSIPGHNSYYLRDRALAVGGYDTSLVCREDTEIFERLYPHGGEHFIHDERARAYTSARRFNATPVMDSIATALYKRGVLRNTAFSSERQYALEDVR